MPIIVNEIPPFLTTVLAGRTVEVGVGARISLVDETDQVILYGSFMFIRTIIFRLAANDRVGVKTTG